MRTLLFALFVSVASVASAQYPGGVWTAGPYQKSRVSPGYLYYDPTALVYGVAANPFGSGYYGSSYYSWQTRNELRRLRWDMEDAEFNRRWGR